jgi:hypothetical protein
MRARGIADVWGNRWNMWFSNWFRFAIFDRWRRWPALALWTVFVVSGLMHEWGINLPLYCVTGRRLFGTMLLSGRRGAGGAPFPETPSPREDYRRLAGGVHARALGVQRRSAACPRSLAGRIGRSLPKSIVMDSPAKAAGWSQPAICGP